MPKLIKPDESKPTPKPAPKPKAKALSTMTEDTPKTKAPKEPKQTEKKPVTVIREIIKQVPRQKRAPSEFNNFISKHVKDQKLSFQEAISKWNEQKAKKQE